MGKRRKGFKPQDVSILDSDDERAYTNIQDPDVDSRDYIYDDIDEFHAGRDKVLLDSGVKYNAADSDDQEEVLSVLSDEDLLSDEDFSQYRTHLLRYKRQKMKEKMGSDMEDEDDNEKEGKERKGWGKKRSQFYGADFDEFVDLSGSDNDQKKAILEEKEALDIQKKMIEEMDEDDFGLEEFKLPDKKLDEELENQEKIVKDLSKLSKREKLELLKKESPELLTLIEDFKNKLSEVKETIQPLFKLVQEGRIVDKAADYIKVKFHLNLSYCVNISFYLMLKAKHIPTINHPVIKRLVQYRKLIKELEPVDQKLEKDINIIMKKIQNGEEVNFAPLPVEEEEKPVFKRREMKDSVRRRVEERRQIADSDSETDNKKHKQMKQIKRKGDETEAEKQALDFYDMLKNKKNKKNENAEEEEVDLEKAYRQAAGEFDDEDGDEFGDKRAITNQIQKNRGLTPSRKRELKNPRVRHRHKFRKAKIRRKGQVREVRTESRRYGGEMTGIRAGIKRGTKLK